MNPTADLQRRLRALSPLQRALLARRLDEQATEVAPKASVAQLVAYVVSDGSSAPSTADVRGFLEDRVPDFMVPSAVVVLDALPRTPNGKIDRNSLPAPGASAGHETGTPPRDAVEAQLAAIWSAVLGVERVGVYDNFFEIGGDSISSIQIISRANQAGLRLKPSQFFEHPTIAALASVAGASGTDAIAEPEADGPVALTPIQRWFFEQDVPERGHWNQTLSLDLTPAIDTPRLERALHVVARFHDAFRLRFAPGPDGWSQRLDPAKTDRMSVAHHDLSATLPEAQEEHVAAIWSGSQDGFDLDAGPLLRAAFVDRGTGVPYRLILTAHHLIIDVISWQTFLADVETVYGQLGRGEEPRPTPPGASLRQWADALEREARSAETHAERSYWTEAARAASPLPADGEGPNTEASAETVIVRLDAAETQALSDATAAYGMKVHEIVLTALAGALASWAGTPRVAIDFESHGRIEIDEALDVTRTVGWFTTLYPVALTPGSLDDPRAALTQVKEQLRAVPRQGVGYGLLRYLGDADRPHFEASAPGVLFNYLGHASPGFGEGSPFQKLEELWGSHGASGVRAHPIEINAFVDAGALTIRWTYSANVHHAATVERLAKATRTALCALVAHCLTPDAGAYTPSDFPDIDLDQDDLDALLGDFE